MGKLRHTLGQVNFLASWVFCFTELGSEHTSTAPPPKDHHLQLQLLAPSVDKHLCVVRSLTVPEVWVQVGLLLNMLGNSLEMLQYSDLLQDPVSAL